MEHEPEVEIEHGHTPVHRRVGIMIAIMAAGLAFTEMASRNADTDVVRETVEAADTWAFYQAKTIRAAMLRADAKRAIASNHRQARGGYRPGRKDRRGLGSQPRHARPRNPPRAKVARNLR